MKGKRDDVIDGEIVGEPTRVVVKETKRPKERRTVEVEVDLSEMMRAFGGRLLWDAFRAAAPNTAAAMERAAQHAAARKTTTVRKRR